jgi:pimeloyl-ACP methyl ester carboxylesterase
LPDDFHPFRSAAARDEYLAFYDERSRRWPMPGEARLVDTSFGQTFVRVQGPAAGPPLVLLPGDSENSLAWIPVIEALSADYRTYAVDHIFDIGRSVYTQRMQTPDDFVRWLDELFTALGLDTLSLMGHSYGGWQASLYALAHPERLERLVLSAPPSTVLRPPLGLIVRAILYYFIPTRFVTKRYMYWYASDAVRNPDTRRIIDEMIDEDLLARQCFKRRRFVPPTVLTDQDWQKLRVPALFLVGENDVTYSAHKAAQRLNRVVPLVRTEIASGADHHLALVKPEWVSNNVLEFLRTP